MVVKQSQAHIVLGVSRTTIEMACGEVKLIPEELQGVIPMGQPDNLNPEDADCPGCRDWYLVMDGHRHIWEWDKGDPSVGIYGNYVCVVEECWEDMPSNRDFNDDDWFTPRAYILDLLQRRMCDEMEGE